MIDPRLQERRREVAEEQARRSARRLLRFLVVLGVAGLAVWVAFSPWMRVTQVRTSGIVVSDSYTVLAAQQVVAGRPMILLRTSQVEEALQEDPWVRRARVQRQWPDEVIIQIEERTPVAWVETSGGWTRRDVDGVALPSPTTPGQDLPVIRLPEIAEDEAAASAWVRGALEFVGALGRGGQAGALVWASAGEIWAEVSGFQVRLGRPEEMRAKALALEALLREDLAPGSILVLIAPGHPAVSTPDSQTEVGEGGETEQP
jgi:hypothetical protein